MSASASGPASIRRTRCGTRLAIPQIVPAPPAATALAISTSAPTSAATSGAAALNARKVAKSPLLSFTPATTVP